MDVKITKTKPEHWGFALSVATQFEADWPDRKGFMAGVVYTAKGRRFMHTAQRRRSSCGEIWRKPHDTRK